MGIAIFYRQNNGGTAQPFRDPGRCEPYHPAMPSFACDHYKMLLVDVFSFEKSQLGYFLLHLLPLSVAAVEQRRETTSFVILISLKKLDHVLSNIHTASGIYP